MINIINTSCEVYTSAYTLYLLSDSMFDNAGFLTMVPLLYNQGHYSVCSGTCGANVSRALRKMAIAGEKWR